MVDETRDFYNGEEVSGVIRHQQGYRFNYLLESVDTPGEAITMTAWDSREDAETYEQKRDIPGTPREIPAVFRGASGA